MNIATLAWLMSSAVSCRPVTPSKSLRICVPSLRHRCLSGFCRLAFSRRGSLGMKIAFSGASTLSCLQVLCPYYLGTGQLTGQLHGPCPPNWPKFRPSRRSGGGEGGRGGLGLASIAPDITSSSKLSTSPISVEAFFSVRRPARQTRDRLAHSAQRCQV